MDYFWPESSTPIQCPGEIVACSQRYDSYSCNKTCYKDKDCCRLEIERVKGTWFAMRKGHRVHYWKDPTNCTIASTGWKEKSDEVKSHPYLSFDQIWLLTHSWPFPGFKIRGYWGQCFFLLCPIAFYLH